MKILFTIILLTYLLTSVSYGQVKIGLPGGAPQASAVLDLSNMGDGTRGVALPRVASIASIVTPVNGLLIYDLSSNCLKVYQNGTWSACISSAASGADVNCASSAINGNYNQGTALTAANTVTIVVINITSTALTITPSIGDITLGGSAAAGMSVASVSPASVSPAAGGGTSTITYTLSGSPTTAGAFAATWARLGLTCAKTGSVCLAIAPIVVTNTLTPSPLVVPIVAGNTMNFTATGGTPNSTGISWTMSSSPAGLFSNPASGTGSTPQAILVAGASGTVTVTFTATNACGLVVTGTGTAATSPDNLREALVAAGCASCAAYDAAAANDYVQITVAEYDNFTTTISGITNYGMKLADRNLIQGRSSYTSYMFTNNIPTTAIPFAFSTKVATGNVCVKLITQSSNILTGPAETSWGTAAGISFGATAGTYYFVIKKPTILMPANTNIAVHGYWDGWGSMSGGTGVDGATSSNPSNGTANSEQDCGLILNPASQLAPAGTPSSIFYLNYDIKWTSTKQW